MILYRRFFASAFRFVIGLAVTGLLLILVSAAVFDRLIALIMPPLKSARLRIVALAAKCRHRITFAGGLFVQAVSA